MDKDHIRQRLLDVASINQHFQPHFEMLASIAKTASTLPDSSLLKYDFTQLDLSLGAIADLRTSGFLELAQRFDRNMADLSAVLAAEQRFELPHLQDLNLLFAQTNTAISRDVIERYKLTLSEISSSMSSMHHAWLNTADQIQSLGSFATIHGMGSMLRTLPAFDTQLVEALRVDLGDWREAVAWPSGIDTDPIIRRSFYIKQGLNPELTTFPHPAFQEIVTSAGLLRPEVAEAEDYDLDDEHDEMEQEAAFERTNKAHDRFQRFESQIRSYIDKRMSSIFGDKWIKHRIPKEMKEKWLDKQSKDIGARRWALIAYADFTDYVTIFTRNDNWNELFAPVFQHKASVQESFRRLYPIRVATMHARPITHDDELYLYIELKRILSAIGITI